MKQVSDLKKKDIPVAVLEILSQGPNHGYAIVREIERLSDTAMRLREGMIYPVLRALEQDGLVTSEWRMPANGPARKTYRITDAGAQELAHRKGGMSQYAETIGRILRGDNHAEQTA